jgi:hypothetical protein
MEANDRNPIEDATKTNSTNITTKAIKNAITLSKPFTIIKNICRNFSPMLPLLLHLPMRFAASETSF